MNGYYDSEDDLSVVELDIFGNPVHYQDNYEVFQLQNYPQYILDDFTPTPSPPQTVSLQDFREMIRPNVNFRTGLDILRRDEFLLPAPPTPPEFVEGYPEDEDDTQKRIRRRIPPHLRKY